VTVVPPADTVNVVTACVQLTLTSALSSGAVGNTMVPAANPAVGVNNSQVLPAETATEKPVDDGDAYCVVNVPGIDRLLCMYVWSVLMDALRASPEFCT